MCDPDKDVGLLLRLDHSGLTPTGEATKIANEFILDNMLSVPKVNGPLRTFAQRVAKGDDPYDREMDVIDKPGTLTESNGSVSVTLDPLSITLLHQVEVQADADGDGFATPPHATSPARVEMASITGFAPVGPVE